MESRSALDEISVPVGTTFNYIATSYNRMYSLRVTGRLHVRIS